MTQYHHLQLYSGLILPQLDLEAESHSPATQGDPIRAPKQPAIHPNQQFFFVAKYMASIRNSWPSITTYNFIPVSAYLSRT